MIDSNNQFKKLSHDLINSVRDVMEATKEGGIPKTDKHKDLAAKAPPYDKITHADVLVGRGVLKKHPTTGKLVTKEEAEAIDELSRKTLGSYVKKAAVSAANQAHVYGVKQTEKDESMPRGWTQPWHLSDKDIKKLHTKADRRLQNIGKAANKLAKEEVEEIDELSRKTLGSYVKKASTSVANKGAEYGAKKAEADEMDRMMNRHMSHSDKDKVRDIMKTNFTDYEKPREKAGRRIKGINKAVDKLTREGSGLDLARTVLNNIRNELAEEIDESRESRYPWLDHPDRPGAQKKKAYDAHFESQPQAVQTRLNAHLSAGLSYPEAVAKVQKSVDLRNKIKPMKEDVESIDEALDAAARYGQHHAAIKDLLKSIDQHVRSHKEAATKHQDVGYQYYRGKKGINWGHVGELAQVHSQLADIHDRLAQQGEYKKSMSESVDEDVDQIDELSKKTLGSYIKKAGKQATSARGYEIHANTLKYFDAGRREMKHRMKREKGIEKAVDKLTSESVDEAYDAAATDRYRKAFGPGGTVQQKRNAMNWLDPKDTNDEAKARTPEQHKKRYQEYLDLVKKGKTEGNRTLHSLATNAAASYKTFHDLKEDLELDEARGRPRKNPLPPGKNVDPNEVEARMHIIQQLERAKLSMRGGEPVTFMDGTKHTVHSPDANKIIVKYHSMKPYEKEAFQKKIHASHAGLKAEL